MGKTKATITRAEVAATLALAGARAEDAIRAGLRAQRPQGMPPELRRPDMQALAASISVAEDWLELRASTRTDRARDALRVLRRRLEDLGGEATCDYRAVRATVHQSLGA